MITIDISGIGTVTLLRAHQVAGTSLDTKVLVRVPGNTYDQYVCWTIGTGGDGRLHAYWGHYFADRFAAETRFEEIIAKVSTPI